MARRLSESSTDSWSLVERRSSVESSDDETGEIVTRDIGFDDYDSDSIGNDSMEDEQDLSDEESDVEEAEEAIEQDESETETEDEQEDDEVEQIEEEEGLKDSAARHFVPAHKIADSLDELANVSESPVEEMVFSAVSTPEKMRLFVLISLICTFFVGICLQSAITAHLSLITPTKDTRGLQRRVVPKSRSPEEAECLYEFLRDHSVLPLHPIRESAERALFMRYKRAFPTHDDSQIQLPSVKDEGLCRAPLNLSSLEKTVPVFARQPAKPVLFSLSRLSAQPTTPAPQVYPTKPLPSINNLIKNHTENYQCSRVYEYRKTSIRPMGPPKSRSICTVKQSSFLKPTETKGHLPRVRHQTTGPKPCNQATRPCNPHVRPCNPCPCIPPTPPPSTKTRPTVAPTVTKSILKSKYATTLYRNYSVSRVYPAKSTRVVPKPIKPTKSITTSAKKSLTRDFRNKSVSMGAPTVIYTSTSTTKSKSIMKKTAHAAGYCDRRMVKENRGVPCVSYKEELPCLSDSPRRVIPSKRLAPTPKTWSDSSSKIVEKRKTRSITKKDYIRRIPLL